MEPTIESLRPLGAGEMMDQALVATRRHFWPVVRSGLPAYLCASIINIAYTPVSFEDGWYMIGVVFLFSGLAESLAIAAAFDFTEGRTPSFRTSWARVRPRLFAASIGYSLKWAMAIAGLVLLVVPGLYLLSVFFAVPAASIIEGLGFRAARKRSLQLARPNLLRLVTSIGLLELVIGALSFGFGYVIKHAFPHFPFRLITLAAEAGGLVVLSYRGILTVLLYRDCRVRLEGFDLEQLARTIEVQPNPV